MSRFLYAWELGSNLGHLGTFTPVAERLRREGHELILSVPETRSCQTMLGEDWDWMQAPHADAVAGAPPPLSYTDILAGVGYAKPSVLMGLVVAWRTLMRLARPQLVFADHAPTAILAARTLDIPVMLFASGFFLPPRRSPLPAMRTWETVDEGALAARDAAVLASVNSVLAQLNTPTLAALYELFDVADASLLTLPELDHYPDRGPARYWGVLALRDGGPHGRLQWPGGAGPRIYAYVRGPGAASTAILGALGASGCPSIVFFPDADTTPQLAPNLLLIRQPVNLTHVLAEADVAVMNGPTTASAFLMAGKPVLLVAQHLKQFLFGLRVAQSGAGLVARADRELGDIPRTLHRLLFDQGFAHRAKSLSKKYAAFDHAAVLDAICVRATQLAS